jgi:single-strand DNA-binding protein
MINKVFLIGNLGRDPEVRRLESGVAVAKFSLATNENYKDKNGEWQTLTEWHDVVAWRGLAERVERELKKGKLAYVEGKLTHRKYQDKDGNDRYVTEVLANVIRLLERRESAGDYTANMPGAENMPPAVAANNPVDSTATKTQQPVVTNDANTSDAGGSGVDDDLPF